MGRTCAEGPWMVRCPATLWQGGTQLRAATWRQTPPQREGGMLLAAGFPEFLRLPHPPRAAAKHVEGLGAQETRGLVRRGGTGKQISLRLVAAHVAQQLQLLPALDAFGHDLDVQVACHGDDGADDGMVGEVGDDVAHETAVDLDPV